MKWAWSSFPGCAGMICSLAANKWDLEGSPDSRANLLFLTSTVCGSSGEMREDGGCKLQGERPEPAKTRFLVAPGDFKSWSGVPDALRLLLVCLRQFCVQITSPSQTAVGMSRVPLPESHRSCGGCFLCSYLGKEDLNFSKLSVTRRFFFAFFHP